MALDEDGDLVKEADAYGSSKHQADRHVEDEEGVRQAGVALALPGLAAVGQGPRGWGAGPRPPRAGILLRPVRRRTEPVRLEGSWAGWGARGESSNSGYQAEAFGVSSL